jgi:hypothetical protein
MIKEAIVKHIIIIDNGLGPLKALRDMFRNYDEGEKDILLLLYCRDEMESKELQKKDDFDRMDVIGIDNLLSGAFFNEIRKRIENDPDCWALIDIELDEKDPHNFKTYKKWESVNFAEKLVENNVVKKNRLFFYTVITDWGPRVSKFRKDTEERWNEPLARPVINDSMSNEMQKKAFVERVMNPIKVNNVDEEDK